MDRKTYSNRLYAEFARVGKATASPRRLQLLELLSQGARTVETLAERAGLSVANTSQHLQTLRRSGLVRSERDGQYVTYSLAGPDVRTFLDSLRALGHARIAEVDQLRRAYLQDRGSMEPLDGESLIERIRSGDVTVVDVRPPEEYAAGHIPGAVSMPLRTLRDDLERLPRDKDVVAYCRGVYCVMAVEAVDLLRGAGFNAFRVEEGVFELEEQGLEPATGSTGHPPAR